MEKNVRLRRYDTENVKITPNIPCWESNYILWAFWIHIRSHSTYLYSFMLDNYLTIAFISRAVTKCITRTFDVSKRLSTGSFVFISTDILSGRALCSARRYPIPRARDIRAYLPTYAITLTRISQRNNIPSVSRSSPPLTAARAIPSLTKSIRAIKRAVAG